MRRLVGLSHWIVDRAIEKYFTRQQRTWLDRLDEKSSRPREIASICILISGGNDSTVLAHMFRHRATHALHANTGIGIEETRQFVRDVCAEWGVPLIEKRPAERDSYRTYVLANGFPGPGKHYQMFQRLKERCMEQARTDLVAHPYRERVLFLGGRRRSESSRRKDITTWSRKRSMAFAGPMTMWTKPDLVTYRIMCGDVPVNEVADLIHMSGECLCGSFAEKGELEMIAAWYPQVVAEIEALEGEIADREDIPEERRKWGWGAYREDLATLKARGVFRSGEMCTSCAGRATGGEVITTPDWEAVA